MLLEHQFVTTLEMDPALSTFDAAMRSISFLSERTTSPSDRQYTNGRAKAQKAVKMTDLPIRCWVGYDRGRITLAASVEENARFAKQRPQLQELLLSLADGVEKTIVAGTPHEVAFARWKAVEAQSEAHFRRRKRRLRIGFGVFVALIGALIGLAISSAKR